jgi:hypothetical protein
MNSHVEWSTLGWVALALWWLVLPAIAVVLSRVVTPATAPRSRHLVRDPGPLDRATEAFRERTWRGCGRLLWLAAGRVGTGRARWTWVRRLSGRCTRRAAMLELRRRRRENVAAALDVQARAWARTLDSSRSSATILPPAAPRPRPALDFTADESTRRWERTLPWGTPSPLMTREGRAKPYPFVPLSPYRTAAPVPPEPRSSSACTPGCPSHNVPRIPMGAFEAPPSTSSSRRARRNP